MFLQVAIEIEEKWTSFFVRMEKSQVHSFEDWKQSCSFTLQWNPVFEKCSIKNLFSKLPQSSQDVCNSPLCVINFTSILMWPCWREVSIKSAPWVFFTFFKIVQLVPNRAHKWYQIAHRITSVNNCFWNTLWRTLSVDSLHSWKV